MSKIKYDREALYTKIRELISQNGDKAKEYFSRFSNRKNEELDSLIKNYNPGVNTRATQVENENNSVIEEILSDKLDRAIALLTEVKKALNCVVLPTLFDVDSNPEILVKSEVEITTERENEENKALLDEMNELSKGFFDIKL